MSAEHRPMINAIVNECRASYAVFEMKDLQRLYAILPDRTVERLDQIPPHKCRDLVLASISSLGEKHRKNLYNDFYENYTVCDDLFRWYSLEKLCYMKLLTVYTSRDEAAQHLPPPPVPKVPVLLPSAPSVMTVSALEWICVKYGYKLVARLKKTTINGKNFCSMRYTAYRFATPTLASVEIYLCGVRTLQTITEQDVCDLLTQATMQEKKR